MDVIYSPEFTEWNPVGPTAGRRFSNFMRAAIAAEVPLILHGPRQIYRAELMMCHTPAFIDDLYQGYSPEVWDGENTRQAEVALLMAGGTMVGLNRILTGLTDIAFNPAGAKHHAMADRGSGFCAINDMAIAAQLAATRGMRVAYIDIDAHHGDGVESLTRANSKILTYSVHSGQLFPGTGFSDEPKNHVFNTPLGPDSGDEELIDALINDCVPAVRSFNPDIIMYAAGADGHMLDPLSDLKYTLDGFVIATDIVKKLADANCDGKILVGGAGGYRPDDATPATWMMIAAALSGMEMNKS